MFFVSIMPLNITHVVFSFSVDMTSNTSRGSSVIYRHTECGDKSVQGYTPFSGHQ